MTSARIDWRDGGVPASRRFDDPYFSLTGGLEETRHVFLAGNDLPARLRPGFGIAELGFGTGLNLLAVMALEPPPLTFTSFELEPVSRDTAARALAAFPEMAALSAPLLAAWHVLGTGPVTLGTVTLDLRLGDARETLPDWEGRADAWFLDGFSPAKNPELWGTDLLSQVGAHTAPGGTLATYTAAGHVRRALEAAGFEITRATGYGRKRHMTCGVKR